MIGWEALVSPEAQQYLWANPASIWLLKDWTRKLVWWIVEIPEARYQTYKWLSDREKEMIDGISEGNLHKIQAILSNYI
jgi:hypothetical protein